MLGGGSTSTARFTAPLMRRTSDPMLTLVLWICVAANLGAAAVSIRLTRRLKRDRGQDAEMLNLAAHIVRTAGAGEYLDGTVAQAIADDLHQQAVRALILAGHYDREMRQWIRRHGDS